MRNKVLWPLNKLWKSTPMIREVTHWQGKPSVAIPQSVGFFTRVSSPALEYLCTTVTGSLILLRLRLEQVGSRSWRRGTAQSRARHFISVHFPGEHFPTKGKSLMKKSKRMSLEMFFSARMHKVDVPLRITVSENGTWWKSVALFLQKHVHLLKINDPFLVHKCDEVIEFLEKCNDKCHMARSFDIKDLYLSLPHRKLLLCWRLYRELRFRCLSQ